MTIIDPELAHLRAQNSQLRAALATASQQQARVAAALGTEPGEDVATEAYAVAGILRKTCAALGIHDEDATDIPGMVSKLSELAAEATKALGYFSATDSAFGFSRALARKLDRAAEEAETRTRKACADQINAAQACIDRATKEHEAERSKLLAHITEAERERDESRASHHQMVTALRDALGLPPDVDPGPAAVAAIRGFAQYEAAARCLRSLLTLSPAA